MTIKEFKVVTSIKLDKNFKPVSLAFRSISVIRDKISASDVQHYRFGLRDNKKPEGFVYSEPTVTHPSGVLRNTTILLGTRDKYMKIDENKYLYWSYIFTESSFDTTWVDLDKSFDLFEYLDSLFIPYSVSSALDVLMLSQIDKPVALFAINYKDTCLSVPNNVKYLYIDTVDNPSLEHVYLSSDLKFVAVRNESNSDFISSITSDILGADVTVSNLIIINNANQSAVAPSMRIKAVLHLDFHGVTVPEISITSQYSEIGHSNIPVIQLKSPGYMPSFTLHSSLSDVEVRNYSLNPMISFFCSYPTPQVRVTLMSSFPIYSLYLMTGFHRFEAIFPYCESFEAAHSYNFTANGFFRQLNCDIAVRETNIRYKGEKINYAGTAEIRTYADDVVFRMPENFFEGETPVRISRKSLM